MSAINGDKARHHRRRKQKIARRKQTRELRERTAAHAKSMPTPTIPPKSVQA